MKNPDVPSGITTDRRELNEVKCRSAEDGNFFHGTGKEAQDLLLLSSMFFGVETSYWFTNKGYYLSPIRGNAFRATNVFSDNVNWNLSIGYKENSISDAWRYEQIYKPDLEHLYIVNPDKRYISRHGFAKVHYRAHTHPGSRPPGLGDHNHSFILGYRGKIFGWNGAIYNYRGYYYRNILND